MESLSVHKGEHPKPENSIRFVWISDTHNATNNFEVPNGDVLLHAGDFTKKGTPQQVSHFNKFLQSLPHEHKVVIAGNHDLLFDLENWDRLRERFMLPKTIDAVSSKNSLENWIYLEESGCEIYGYKIWGSPWTPNFWNWAFNAERGEAMAYYMNKIPEGTEILLTHGPPFDIQDRTRNGTKAGWLDLLNRISEVKPLVHLFGHIHEAYGWQRQNGTLFINGSNCTLRYRTEQPAIVFDLPLK